MAHAHSVYDSDAHFIIDPITRGIKNDSSKKTVLIQGDHNSERFTFQVEKLVDGHDLSQCNSVQVHFLNIDGTNKSNVSSGYLDLDDLQVSPDSEDVVIVSWLISNKCTKYAGSLTFLLKFKCVSDDGTVDYVWNTARYSGISISPGMENSSIDPGEDDSIIAEWEARISALEAQVPVYVTEDEYAALEAAGTVDQNAPYFIYG